MHRRPSRATRGAIRMGLLLGVAIATLVAMVVGVIGYTTNHEVDGIFDRSARDSRTIAADNVSRFAQLLASNTATNVRPAVLDHNYSYIRGALADMITRDEALLHVAVYDADDALIEKNGRDASDAHAMQASAAITSRGQTVGKVELVYSMSSVNERLENTAAANQKQRADSIRNLLVGGGLVLAIGVIIAAAFGMWLSRPVIRMAEAAGELGEGKFDVRVNVGGPREIRQLAGTFNSMASELEASVSASIEQAALEREVATARRLQRQMMPPETRITAGNFEIASWYEPAGKMGGDWWTVSEADGDKPITVMIGDVIGHGIPAALFTAAAKSAYRAAGALGADNSPDQILSTIDQALRGFSETHTMSCCALQLDLEANELVLSVGAHPAPMRISADGSIDILDGEGPLLGDPNPGASFGCSRHPMKPGDVVALFTDGIVEATDERERMFGLRRLGAAIQANIDQDLETILAELKNAFSSYIGEQEVDDDVTVVLVRYLPVEDRVAQG